MPESDCRRRINGDRRATAKSRASRSSPWSAGRRRIKADARVHLLKSARGARILQRCKSEPALLLASGGNNSAEDEEDQVFPRLKTCADIYSSQEISSRSSPRSCSRGYSKDAKVVVNVTVEGSAGPIRTLVKLGSNVGEIVNLVINKYNEEGRTPRIHQDSASTCELHHSYFSLQRLNNSDLIGDIGRRSFYLRRTGGASDSSSHDINGLNAGTPPPPVAGPPFEPGFIVQKIKKMIQTAPRFWSILRCIPCIS